MEKKVLANELRIRQVGLGINPPELINSLSDQDIIDSYFTCAECGEREITSELLDWLISKAQSADHLFALVDQIKPKT